MTKKLAHSPLGASTCERWWNCPGSVKKIQSAPAEKPNYYMAEGSVAHKVAEEILRGVLANESKDMYEPIIGTHMPFDGHKILITDEMIDAAYVYVDYILQQIKDHHIPKKSINIEHRVQVDKTRQLFGTADCDMHNIYQILVNDFKYGAGTFVPTKGNKQLQYYALGSYLMRSKLIREEISEVHMSIVQPRMKGIDKTVIPIEELTDFHHELLIRADKAIEQLDVPEPELELNAGHWCIDHFCPVRNDCAAFKKYRSDETGTELALLADAVDARSLSTLDWTPENVAKMYANIDILKTFIKDIEAEARRLANQGGLPGYKIVQTEGKRAWVDEAKVKLFVEKLGDDAYMTKLKSPAQLEKAVKAHNKSAAYEDQIIDTQDLAKLWHKPITGDTVVPESDSRPDAKPDVLKDFQDVVDAEIINI